MAPLGAVGESERSKAQERSARQKIVVPDHGRTVARVEAKDSEDLPGPGATAHEAAVLHRAKRTVPEKSPEPASFRDGGARDLAHK
jgi:hypothetical protein